MTKLPPAVLPNWRPRTELSRPSAERLSRAENRKQTLTYAGPNAVIPIVYGEQIVGGPVIAGPVVSGGSIIWAVALCWAGEAGIGGIEDVRVGETIGAIGEITNDNLGATGSAAGVSVRVFNGRQTVPWSGLVSAIPGFSDSFSGVAYAFLSTPAATFSSFPQVVFRVKGRLCGISGGSAPGWSSVNPGAGQAITVVDDSEGRIVVGTSGGRVRRLETNGVWAELQSPFPPSSVVGKSDRYLIGGGKVSLTNSNTVLRTLSETNDIAFTQRVVTQGSDNVRGYHFRVMVAAGGFYISAYGSSTVAVSGTMIRARLDAHARLSQSISLTSLSAPPGGGSVLTVVPLNETSFVLAGTGGGVWTGSSTLTRRSAGFGTTTIRRLVNSNGVIFAFGDQGKAARSSDGITWVAEDSGFGTEDIIDAAAVGSEIFALSATGRVRGAVAGFGWKEVDVSGIPPITRLYSANNKLVALTGGVSYFEVDPSDVLGKEWTENPVLHMYDFVTNTEFGMGAQMIGAEHAARVADSLYSGLPRSRTGLSIQDPMTEEDALALFASYAEVLWSYDGQDVSVIPDAPVDTIHPIDPSTIREGSLSMSTVGLEQVPTQVRIMFSDRDEPTWASRPAVAEVPEHTLHGMPTSPSSVPMPGVFNRLEAERRAYQRLMRLQAPGRIEWQMFAPGMPYQAGDVVRLPDRRGLQSVDVRITAQPEMVGPLLYQMGGEIYRASDYPAGADGVAVPTGAILILRGSGAVPAGWTLVSIADRLIREGAPGNAGSNMNLSATFQSNLAGEHSGTRDTATRLLPIIFNEGTPGISGPLVYFNYGGTPGPHVSGAHRHSFGISKAAHLTVRRRAFRFIKRTGAAGLLPRGVSFLGAENLTNTHVIESPALNTYLAGGSAEAALPVDNSFSGAVSGGGHTHNAVVGRAMSGSNPSKSYQLAEESGQHSHSAYAEITSELRSMALALFESLGDAALPEGAIVGWDGGTPPAGWALCDGNNGTIDLTERFIYLTAVSAAGAEHRALSEYEISGTISGSSGSHRHTRVFTSRTELTHTNAALNPFHDSMEGDHSHYVESVSGNPTGSLDNILRYQLRFIQYVGE